MASLWLSKCLVDIVVNYLRFFSPQSSIIIYQTSGQLMTTHKYVETVYCTEYRLLLNPLVPLQTLHEVIFWKSNISLTRVFCTASNVFSHSRHCLLKLVTSPVCIPTDFFNAVLFKCKRYLKESTKCLPFKTC